METLKITDFQKIKELVDGQLLFLYVCDYWNTELIAQLRYHEIKLHGVCSCYPRDGIHEPTGTSYLQPAELLKYPNSFILTTSNFANENIAYLTEHGFPIERVISFPFGKTLNLSNASNSESSFPPLPSNITSSFPPIPDALMETNSVLSDRQEQLDGMKINNWQNHNLSQDYKLDGNPQSITKSRILSWINQYSTILLILILLVQLITMIYFVGQKNGYNLDEMFSLQQANGRLFRGLIHFDPNIFDRWITGQDMMNFHIVQYEYRFNFRHIFQTLSYDVHPPFHNLQLHLIGSLFPNQFNIWMLAVINIFWMLGTTIMLYLSSELLFKQAKSGKTIALLPPLLWSLSYSLVNYTVFFRMYTTMIFFVTALAYLGLRVIDDVNQNKNTKPLIYIILSVVLVLGWFTMHLFAITAVLAGVFLLIWLLIKKEYNRAILFTITGILSIVIFLLVWPATIDQVFGSFRGINYMQVTISSYIVRLQNYFYILSRELFGGRLNIVLILMIISIVLMIAAGKKKLMFNGGIIFLLFIMLGSFFAIIWVAPDMAFNYIGRYISGLHPMIVLLFVFWIIYIYSSIKFVKIIKPLAAILFVGVMSLNLHSRSRAHYLYNPKGFGPESMFNHYENSHLIAIVNDWRYYIQLPNHYLDFANFANFYMLMAADMSVYPEIRFDDWRGWLHYQLDIGSWEIRWRRALAAKESMDNLFIADFPVQNRERFNHALEIARSILGDFSLELHTILHPFNFYELHIYRVVWHRDLEPIVTTCVFQNEDMELMITANSIGNAVTSAIIQATLTAEVLEAQGETTGECVTNGDLVICTNEVTMEELRDMGMPVDLGTFIELQEHLGYICN